MSFTSVLGNLTYHFFGEDYLRFIQKITSPEGMPNILILPEDHTWTNETYYEILKRTEKDEDGFMYGFYDSLISKMRNYGVKYVPYSEPDYRFEYSHSYITTLHDKERDMLFVLMNKKAFLYYDKFMRKYPEIYSYVIKYTSGERRINEAVDYLYKKHKARFSSIENFIQQLANTHGKIDKEHADELIKNIETTLKINDNILDEYRDKDLKYWATKLKNNINFYTR